MHTRRPTNSAFLMEAPAALARRREQERQNTANMRRRKQGAQELMCYHESPASECQVGKPPFQRGLSAGKRSVAGAPTAARKQQSSYSLTRTDESQSRLFGKLRQGRVCARDMPEETPLHRRQRPRNQTLPKMTCARRACANHPECRHLPSINRTRWRLSSETSNLLARLLLHNLSSAMQAFKTGPIFQAWTLSSAPAGIMNLTSSDEEEACCRQLLWPFVVRLAGRGDDRNSCRGRAQQTCLNLARSCHVRGQAVPEVGLGLAVSNFEI